MDTKTIIMIIMGAVIAVLSYFLVRSYTADVEQEIVTKFDTTYIHDTDTLYLEKEKICYKTITVYDSIFIHTDTVLLFEQKCYEDSLSKIYISGIQPEIDSIFHYIPRDTVVINNTTTITKHKKQGWGQFVGVGAGVGYGLSLGPNPHFEPYVGINIVYGVGLHF